MYANLGFKISEPACDFGRISAFFLMNRIQKVSDVTVCLKSTESTTLNCHGVFILVINQLDAQNLVLQLRLNL